jgi:hypothetical protein
MRGPFWFSWETNANARALAPNNALQRTRYARR